MTHKALFSVLFCLLSATELPDINKFGNYRSELNESIIKGPAEGMEKEKYNGVTEERTSADAKEEQIRAFIRIRD